MKTILTSVLLLTTILQGLSHSQTNAVNSGAAYTAIAWQGNTNSIANIFSGNTIPNGCNLYVWNVSSQDWDIITYFFGSWDQPNYQLTPGQGFLVNAGTPTTFVLSGADVPGTVYTVNLQSNKWYCLGHAYPREGYLEKNPYPWSPGCYLNFPGRTNSANGGFSEEYSRWDESLGDYGDWQFTQRSDDSSTNDRDNPTGGYSNSDYGARWRPPGQTTGYQGNGVSDNWIYLSQPIMYKHFGAAKNWNMYKTNSANGSCP